MSEASSAGVLPESPGAPLGAMEAAGMGWRLLVADFWQMWLAALIVEAILAGIKIIPCLSCLAPITRIFLWPPLMAGLFWVIRDRVDGAPIRMGRLFGAFKHCFWQTVVAGLPVTLAFLVLGVVFFIVGMSLGMTVGLLAGGRGHDMDPAAVAMLYGIDFASILAREAITGIVGLFFMFALLAIWETPQDGWGAAKRAARLMVQNFGAAIVFGLVFGALWFVATLGVLGCCVGIILTMAVFQAWHAASLVYLYRSWTGQPLVQPLPGAAMPDTYAPPEGALPA